jgi:hypothetical protein
MGVERLLIVQDIAIITWILAMEKSSLAINIQQLKLITSFWNEVPRDSY